MATPFEIPDQVREMANQSVGQARNAFTQFLDATRKAVAAAETSSRSLGDSAADVNRQTLAFIQDNIAASFDLAQQLVKARTIEEVTALQQDFVKRQVSAASKHGQSLGEAVGRATPGKAKR